MVGMQDQSDISGSINVIDHIYTIKKKICMHIPTDAENILDKSLTATKNKMLQQARNIGEHPQLRKKYPQHPTEIYTCSLDSGCSIYKTK